MSYLKEKDERLIYELNSNIKFIDKALITFKQSIEKCKEIDIKNEYSYDELVEFEALTSRFSRIADILTQKVLKTLFTIIREDLLTFIDRANFAEKIELVTNAEDLIRIRDLRNDIAHEYFILNITDIFQDTLKYSKTLIEIIGKTKNYINSNIG